MALLTMGRPDRLAAVDTGNELTVATQEVRHHAAGILSILLLPHGEFAWVA